MLPDASAAFTPQILLRVVGLSKRYHQGHWFSKSAHAIEALRGISFDLRYGSTLGIIGPSGTGKSTLARCLAGMEHSDSGEIWFGGKNIAQSDRQLLPFKRQIQLVFQEASASLNPRFTALEIVSEPLLIAGAHKDQRHERALNLMRLVGLPADSAARLPSQFSAGQRRRLAIARSLAPQPKVLILDEAFAGLDLSIRAQISNLLLELQASLFLTYICISHDLELVAHLSDEIAVMDQGEIVEIARAADFLAHPEELRALQVRGSPTQTKTSSQAGSQ